jgi:hypothetical protein
LAGRAIGTVVTFEYTPDRSGWPSAVRGIADDFTAAADVLVAAAGACAKAGTVSRAANRAAVDREPNDRGFICISFTDLLA